MPNFSYCHRYARNKDYFIQTEVDRDSLVINYDDFEDVMLDEIVERYPNYAVLKVTTFIGSKNLTDKERNPYNGEDYFGPDDDWWIE